MHLKTYKFYFLNNIFRLAACTIIFSLYACKNKPAELSNTSNVNQEDDLTYKEEIGIKDSLLNLYFNNMFHDEGDFQILNVYNLDVGLWERYSADNNIDKIYLIQNIDSLNSKGMIIDKLMRKGDGPTMSTIDLNGDDLEDILLSFSNGNNENYSNTVFIYHPEKKRFIYNKYYDLDRVNYDTIYKFVTSSNYWKWGGYKQIWRIAGDRLIPDSLIVLSGIKYYQEDEDNPILKYYVYKNGKKVLINTKKGDAQSLVDEFYTTLWNDVD